MSRRKFDHLIKQLEFKRDRAIINCKSELVDKLNNEIDALYSASSKAMQSKINNSFKANSSRLTRPKRSAGFSRSNAVMGYAKPTGNQEISSKYNCIATGEKRMTPCAGCPNPKGCLSRGMQYKEFE